MGGGEPTAVQAPVLSGLEPQAFWGHFDALTRIARPSRQEEAVSDHVRSWAEQHGLEVDGDSAGNLVVRVPASEGRESAPKITLQGHLDMVCEREPDSPNDPAEGRIELARDGELADCERDDARRGRRRRDRSDDGARRGRVESPRAARAPR